MLSVANWQLSDFLNQDNYSQLKKQVEEWWRFDDPGPAWRLYKELVKKEELWNKVENTGLKKAYSELKRRLAYIALPLLEDNEVEGIFKTDLAQVLSYQSDDYNLLNKIKGKLIIMPLFERDDYKAKLIKALEENEEQLTKSPIEKDGEQIEGTIKNWLADFRYYLAEYKTDEKLARAQYLYKAKNVVKLTEADREKVKKLIELYNRLHKSSLTVEGHEGPVVVKDKDGRYLVDDGKIMKLGALTAADRGIVKLKQEEQSVDTKLADKEPIRQPLSAQSAVADQPQVSRSKGEADLKRTASGQAGARSNTLIELQHDYQTFLQTALVKAVDKEMEKLLETSKGDFKALRGYFYHAVNHKRVEQALAALLVIAKLGKIRQAFGEDERFVKFWSKYLKAKNLDAEGFRKDPAQAEFLAMFFKYILEERLNLPSQQAVLVGMLASNLCRQAGELEYQSMAYGDAQSGEFKWNI